MSERKLPFRVVYASSEDPDNPASELDVHSSHTRGWQSARCVALRARGRTTRCSRRRQSPPHHVRPRVLAAHRTIPSVDRHSPLPPLATPSPA